jgi:hypothetical protein
MPRLLSAAPAGCVVGLSVLRLAWQAGFLVVSLCEGSSACAGAFLAPLHLWDGAWWASGSRSGDAGPIADVGLGVVLGYLVGVSVWCSDIWCESRRGARIFGVLRACVEGAVLH